MQRKTMTAFGIGLALGGLALGMTAAAQPEAVAAGTSAAMFVADDTTGSDDMGGAPPQRPDETPLTGSDAEAATAAAEAAVPDGTVLRVETDAGGGGVHEAHVRTSDGTEVVVSMDDTFTVTSVEEHMGHGHHGPGDDADGTTDSTEGSTTASAFAARAVVRR